MSTPPDYLNMSDEELLNTPPPEPEAGEAVADADQAGEDAGTAGGDGQQDDGEAGGEAGEGAAKVPADDAGADKSVASESAEGEDKTLPPAAEKDGSPAKPATDSSPEGKDPSKATGSEVPAAPRDPLTYTADEKVAAFDKMMAPFKANGRDVKLQSPEEVTKLLQMGANYTKKMQALQPQLRVVKMLENNGLLDESKLAHLIDISKGDNSAIQKLLADTNFDPLGADKDKAADYTPGNHSVSDTEIQFSQALDDVGESPLGAELVGEIYKQWDPASKQVLFQNPGLLRDLHQQKEIGLYQLITDEIAHQTALGQIGPEIPFLQAYRAIGDMLNAQGRLKPKGNTVSNQVRTPAETRVAAPASPVANGAKAASAASTKATGSSAAKPVVDYLNQSDDEFLKQMNGRV